MTQDVSHTTMASYLQAFASALEARGVDPQPVFDEAGISIQATSDPLKRISETEVGRLFQASVKATDDPCFGIAVGERMQPGNLHALGFGLLSSTTLRDFYERICNYYHVVSQSADFCSYDQDGESILAATNLVSTVCYETRDAWVTMIVRFLRFLYQQEIKAATRRGRATLPRLFQLSSTLRLRGRSHCDGQQCHGPQVVGREPGYGAA